jgi:hypothetical protein
MTINQRHALEKIAVIRNHQIRRLTEFREKNPAFCEGTKPSEWLFESELTEIHKIPRRMLNSLTNRGWLEKKSSHGWGWEYRIVTSNDDTTCRDCGSQLKTGDDGFGTDSGLCKTHAYRTRERHSGRE